MSPRLSVCAVIAVCLLSCSKTETTSNEPFSDTKTDVNLGQAKRYFTNSWIESDDITVDFSGDAISFVGYFEGTGTLMTDQSAFVSYVETPSGKVLYDLSRFATWYDAIRAHRPVSTQSFGVNTTALVHWPVADDAEPERGKYIIRIAMPKPLGSLSTDGGTTVNGSEALTGTFHAVIRRNEDTSHGKLDLNLFYVQGSGLSTRDDLPVQEAIDTFFADLEPFGIERGNIQTFDVQEGTYTTIDPNDWSASGALSRLMQESKRAPNTRAANVFFVKTVTGSYEAGLSTGIPVALGVEESRHSGVVISAQDPALYNAATGIYDAVRMGHTITHQVGHAVGLQHTTEGDIGDTIIHDLITDTPECPVGANQDKDDYLSPKDCASYDASNTMFWLLTPPGKLTPGQGYMFRHSVIVRGEPRNQ